MKVEIEEGDLKKSLLGLVLALVEIIQEALRLQAVRRMAGGSLSAEEVERLGEALMELDDAIHKLKVEMGVVEAVQAIRGGLDRAVDDALNAWDRTLREVGHGAAR